MKNFLLFPLISITAIAPSFAIEYESDPLRERMPKRESIQQENTTSQKQPVIHRGSFDLAFNEFKKYCLSGVCIGEKLSTIEKHGEITWHSEKPNGKTACPSETHYARLELRNGGQLQLSFAQTKTTGPIEERYRIIEIKYLFLNATKYQREILTQKILTRFAPMQRIEHGILHIWSKTMPSGNSKIIMLVLGLNANPEEITSKPIDGISIFMDYSHKKQWIGLYKECTAGIQEI